MVNKKTGILISFEGGEGGGKSTQAKLLGDYFRDLGRDVLLTREPGGTVISEQIREVVLGTKNIGMAFTTEVLLFQAARAQIYRELILPSLKAEKVVICDRTRDSSVVYQGIVRKFGVAKIEQLNKISTQNTYPDVTFLLDVPVDLGLQRRNQTGEVNRLDIERAQFHQQVRDGYLDLARKNDRSRWVVIDATEGIDEVQRKIIDSIRKNGILK